MTKIHRQPKQPKPARVTLAECKRLAGELGLGFDTEVGLDGEHWFSTLPLSEPRYIYISHPSRSAALRIMHAALVAMRKEQGK